MKKISININGYIEGYYGRLLTWSERHTILKKLKECKFNSYFYCPKEDIKHRLEWRKAYTSKWLSLFKNFCANGYKYDLNILVGISPGLDFNFNENNSDFETLVKKAKILKSCGATHIVLMFDDIPKKDTFNDKISKSEGFLHAELANKLSIELNDMIYVVPRIYSDELIDKGCKYLKDFNKILNKNITLFYCGKKIVSDTNKKEELAKLKKFTSNRIIFWDNLYANDYCPKKIFVGPYLGRSNFFNTMINPTGLIKTDLFILDLIYLSMYYEDLKIGWFKALKKYKVPKQFQIISKYLFTINCKKSIFREKYNFNKEIEALDFLLWKWKSSLSREWYQYLLILKQDLLLFNDDIDIERLNKIFPIPLKNVLVEFKRSKN